MCFFVCCLQLVVELLQCQLPLCCSSGGSGLASSFFLCANQFSVFRTLALPLILWHCISLALLRSSLRGSLALRLCIRPQLAVDTIEPARVLHCLGRLVLFLRHRHRTLLAGAHHVQRYTMQPDGNREGSGATERARPDGCAVCSVKVTRRPGAVQI